MVSKHRLLRGLFFIFVLCFGILSAQQEGVTSSYVEPTYSHTGLAFTYHLFNGAEMKESYPGMYGVHVERFSWIWDNIGVRFGVGVTGTEGTPLQIDPTWQVHSSELGFWALDIQASLVFRLTGGNPMEHITPFVGIGGDAFGATEKFAATISKDTIEFSADASALRFSGGAHAIAGVIIPTGRTNSLQLAVKYFYSSKGGFKDLLSEEKRTEFEQKIYTVVERPVFDLSGISIAITLYL